jgi:hypothetical protein
MKCFGAFAVSSRKRKSKPPARSSAERTGAQLLGAMALLIKEFDRSMHMHYVSQYNYFKSLDRLARSSDNKPDLNEAIAGLSRFSLRDVLNNDEIVTMYQQDDAWCHQAMGQQWRKGRCKCNSGGSTSQGAVFRSSIRHEGEYTSIPCETGV